MKHFNNVSKNLPSQASLFESGQKIAVFQAFATALGAFGNAIGVIIGLGDE